MSASTEPEIAKAPTPRPSDARLGEAALTEIADARRREFTEHVSDMVFDAVAQGDIGAADWIGFTIRLNALLDATVLAAVRRQGEEIARLREALELVEHNVRSLCSAYPERYWQEEDWQSTLDAVHTALAPTDHPRR